VLGRRNSRKDSFINLKTACLEDVAVRVGALDVTKVKGFFTDEGMKTMKPT
jgi:hypothetical protein